MRRTLLAVLLASLIWAPARAERFDSGWRRIAANALADLDLVGGDVRVNNLIVAPEREAETRQKPEQLATYVFSLSAVKRAAGTRSAFVQVVGMTAGGVPTVMSIIAINFGDTDTNRLRTDTHRFPAFPKEVEQTADYFVRLIIQ
ncbi:hypothetical protein JMJ55_05215 [Belnapia sp. T6]|uniref:Uncharacterized protein n=1 Tax=Belnapia mucosa TaxID=2804532 RepID=A0ABS1UZ28_9PROT|nr:hypothetical protein [Belnapia mucosa]MBL6454713.1 hypothetical protein [Belnapia mucosa]